MINSFPCARQIEGVEVELIKSVYPEINAYSPGFFIDDDETIENINKELINRYNPNIVPV